MKRFPQFTEWDGSPLLMRKQLLVEKDRLRHGTQPSLPVTLHPNKRGVKRRKQR